MYPQKLNYPGLKIGECLTGENTRCVNFQLSKELHATATGSISRLKSYLSVFFTNLGKSKI